MYRNKEYLLMFEICARLETMCSTEVGVIQIMRKTILLIFKKIANNNYDCKNSKLVGNISHCIEMKYTTLVNTKVSSFRVL